ncbi:MAG: MtnX-like HAD-IB family phosphatase [Melioribacter sp.]|uniref:MtnX-like HAD-IB family phosphatase n=1 Tax=Rosettibacter primus TaxID=3111523 RepID=UPI00247B57A2|nr:MtnX-like HAD-IB family phosphatase [Melioribacter sp.]
MKEKNFKIFVDFDGTITKEDIGEVMFLKFGDAQKAKEIVNDWINQKINARQSWELLCKTINNLDINKFDDFLLSSEIDNSFKKFIEYCAENNYEVRILSDGLDYYINKILSKENLSHLEVYSNKLSFDNNGNLIPIFPYTDEECKRCANCKRNHVLNFSGDDEFSIYIGDGYSDVCPAQYCDYIFAKKSLLKYCEINRITYFLYSDFNDVIKKIEELKQKKRLKKRYQAELKRKEIYIQG